MSKTALISERIAILEGELGKSGNQLGLDAKIGNGTVGGWTDNQIEKPNAVVEKFLRHHNVRLEWWKSGKGEIFNTPVQNRSDNVGKPLGDDSIGLVRSLLEMEKVGNYMFVPKLFFEGDYKLSLKSERDKTIETLERLVANLEGEVTEKAQQIAELKSLVGKAAPAKKAK